MLSDVASVSVLSGFVEFLCAVCVLWCGCMCMWGGCMYVCVSVCVSACTGALVRIHNDVVVIVCMLTCLCSRVFVIVLSVGTAGEGEQCVECLRQCAHTYGTPVGHSKAFDHPVLYAPLSVGHICSVVYRCKLRGWQRAVLQSV